MGIINCTPDSFYAGSRKQALSDILDTAQRMCADGADILDLGGLSTRPGAAEIPLEEEWNRLQAALPLLRKEFPDIFLSIDSYRAEIIRRAFDAGADIVNDVSAGQFDPELLPTVAQLGAPYILMHAAKNLPRSMQEQLQESENIGYAVWEFFVEKTAELRALGIEELIIDPGFGFGKSLEQNYQLLVQTELLASLGLPLLIGLSRKSMIWKLLGSSPQEALNGTTALQALALAKGGRILRCHDVKEAVETRKLWKALQF